MTKNILITGATGFVGRHVLRELIKRDIKVSVVARKGKAGLLGDNPDLNDIIETASLFSETQSWWSDVFQEIDTVLHLAWYVEPGKYLTAPENLDCVSGTLEMAKAAVKAGVKRFVGIGTCFEYDLEPGILSVETPLKPLTPYAAAKAATYMLLSQYLAFHKIEFAWCRLFYLYGEGEDDRRFVPYLRKCLHSGIQADLTQGKQVRDFLNVEDAAYMIADAAVGKVQGPLNICSGVPVTIRELAEKIADEYGRHDLLNFGARADNLVDPPYILGKKANW